MPSDSIFHATPEPHAHVAPAQQRATRLIFLAAGLAMATWAPLVPFAKARLGIDHGELGLLLLCLGGGSLLTMPVAGALATRFGCRAVIVAATVLLCLTLPCLGSVSSTPLFAIVLLAFGAGMGSIDVAMNIQAILVERASGRVMMSGFHGMYSLGGILGAGMVSVLLALGIAPLMTAVAMAACVALLCLLARAHLLRENGGRNGDRQQGPRFALPRGIVLLLGGLCFVVFMAEGSVLDWSALFLSALHGVAPALAGLGFAAFSLTMTIGRLSGDRVVHRFGGSRILSVGGLLGALGLALAVLLPFWQTALLGFALLGAGCANIVPVLFTAVGRQRTMPENVAVPAMTTLGYGGLLAGPAAIGFIANAYGLRTAFLAILVLLLGAAACARFLPPGRD